VNDERRGLAECAGSAAAFGSVGVLVAVARHEHVGTATLLASRYAIGAIALWLVLLFLRRPLPDLRIALAAVALGATTFAAASGLYLAAIDRMGAGPAGVVSYCYPVLVMAGAILLGRERLSRRRTAAITLAVSGVGLLVAGGGLGAINASGALLAFGSALLYTAYVLASTALRDRVEPLALSTLVATGAAAAFAAAHAVHGGAPVHTPVAALAVVALALLPTAFAVSTFLAGLGRIGPSRASIASSVEPVVAVACGVLVLGERLLPVQFLGAALVIAAVLAIELRRLPRIPVPPLPRIRVFPRLVPRLPRADSVAD
jgi:drug/metabolite transporter (DMT)-like permease